jgi:hypothetical protein
LAALRLRFSFILQLVFEEFCFGCLQAAEQKEADRVAMSEAISAFCQVFGLDDVPSGSVTPGFKGQSRVHLIHAPKKTTYIITECIEINVVIIRVFIT